MGALRHAAPVPSARPFLKRPQVVDTTATCGTAAREKPARHAASAGEEFPVRDPKRAKVTCNGVVGSMSVGAALGVGTLRKRMAAELDAVRALLRKAEFLSGGKNGRSMAAAKQRPQAPVEEASVELKPPPAKRGKASAAALAKTAKLESRDLRLPDDKDEFIDICGGVSPVAIQCVSPLVAAEKACESGDGESSRDLPEDGSEFIDICGGVSPDVSIEKKAVNIPAPPAGVLPEKNGGRSVQPPREPAASEVRSTAEQEELTKGKKRAAPAAVSTAALVAKAKVRRTVLEMERAVVPDESILPRDLKDLCIVEYGRVSIMQHLGLFLKADA